MTRRDVQQRVAKAAVRAELKSKDPKRRKCFVSYSAADADEVEVFLDSLGEAFIPRVIGVTEEDDFIDSDDTDYVMEKIREKYLTDSTVTIVMVGKCTWARKFVDWEVYSSLRNDKNNKRNGLMAITLPSYANYSTKTLPARVDDNVNGNEGYARWWQYPKSVANLQSCIETAFAARTEKEPDNSRDRKTYNSSC